jgi:hypothetical protein
MFLVLSHNDIHRHCSHHGCVVITGRDIWRDLIAANIGQLLIKTYDIPASPSEMFNSFRSHGWELFSKELDTRAGKGYSVDWSWIKLSPEFRLNRAQ